ncbi:MAG: [citrate (pro-3S)-lyase] ligase [Hespellia sp.]|nr:[citrate (pro-3S)-lyase] ligase [Hespellia sp.]MDD3404412.1 [citrate (pro-3S)-lyase] ligase [Hespellia sp.]
MILAGNPLKGKELEKLKQFLEKMDLEYDEGIEYSICILDDDYRIIATGSVEENVLKCIAVDATCQGQGLSGTILSNLIQYEFEKGKVHQFIYTKPKNRDMFEDLSFYTIIENENVLFMENRSNGFRKYIEKMKDETPSEALETGKKIGAVVMNCNPFTLGHRYLLEQASAQCDYVHVFILSDKRSFIPSEDRFMLAYEGSRDIANLIFHKSSDYIISAATFPTYFMKDKVEASHANCGLDVELFAKCIAPALGITERFVGTEPDCGVTGVYNQTMKEILPGYGIALKEIPRVKNAAGIISASVVRENMRKRKWMEVGKMVPDTTLNYLKKLQV